MTAVEVISQSQSIQKTRKNMYVNNHSGNISGNFCMRFNSKMLNL